MWPFSLYERIERLETELEYTRELLHVAQKELEQARRQPNIVYQGVEDVEVMLNHPALAKTIFGELREFLEVYMHSIVGNIVEEVLGKLANHPAQVKIMRDRAEVLHGKSDVCRIEVVIPRFNVTTQFFDSR